MLALRLILPALVASAVLGSPPDALAADTDGFELTSELITTCERSAKWPPYNHLGNRPHPGALPMKSADYFVMSPEAAEETGPSLVGSHHWIIDDLPEVSGPVLLGLFSQQNKGTKIAICRFDLAHYVGEAVENALLDGLGAATFAEENRDFYRTVLMSHHSKGRNLTILLNYPLVTGMKAWPATMKIYTSVD